MSPMRPILLLVLALLLCPQHSWPLRPQEVVVSVAIDAESLEIQREGLRLLQSLALFGGMLQEARVSVCVSHSGRDGPRDQRLLKDLRRMNITDVYFSTRFSLPHAAPTLNKLCAFEPRIMGEGDHLLYLDADVFVAADPLPLLSTHAPLNDSTVLCGRPWNVMNGAMEQFPHFVGNIGARADRFDRVLLETLAAPGTSFPGTCNTGVYFMRAAAARGLLRSARAYLHKAQTDPVFRDVVPFSPTYNGIDSIILWAAQYELDYEAIIFSPRLNWMAAAEPYYARYLSREVEQYRLSTVGTLLDGEGLFEAHRPALLHFSRGSDLRFEQSPPPQPLDPLECRVILKVQKAEDDGKSYVEEFASQHLTPPNVCGLFARLLSAYDPLVANTTWPQSSTVDITYQYHVKNIVPRFSHDSRHCPTAGFQQREYLWCQQQCLFALLSPPRVEAFTEDGDASVRLVLVLQIEIICPAFSRDSIGIKGSAVQFVMSTLDRPESGEHVSAALDFEGRLHSEVHSSTDFIPPVSAYRWQGSDSGGHEFPLSFGASVDSGPGGGSSTVDFDFHAIIVANPLP